MPVLAALFAGFMAFLGLVGIGIFALLMELNSRYWQRKQDEEAKARRRLQ